MLREDHEYETIARFDAAYPGRCILNEDHKIRRGDKVSRVQMADNPMIPVSGVVCSVCTRTLPRAKAREQ